MSDDTQANGPDLTQGVTLADFNAQHLLGGHVGEETVVLAEVNGEVFAIGGSCTHYGGPLSDGLVVGDTVRCPWHHAAFSLRTGEAVQAPAFDPVARWKVEREGNKIFVREKSAGGQAAAHPATQPASVVIVGGGAAGFACAEMLRRRGYTGGLTILSADADAPVDRPNLSKDYLAGSAPEEWIPLKSDDFYRDNNITLKLGTKVTAIDTKGHQVRTAGGESYAYDRLLLATGADPIRIPLPGADLPHVFTLRTLADSRGIVARVKAAKTAVVLGSSFIGLEAAAALRTQGLEVHVVSLDKTPLERVLGTRVGAYVRTLHEAHGVHFHMELSIAKITPTEVILSDNSKIAAELVVMGVGVRPQTALAEAAGLDTDNGVLVNERMETSAPGVYAAGDIARWKGAHGAQRVEHWVVAERQGQVAAENMLGNADTYRDAPFFWSAHYDTTINYVGHAEHFDEVTIDGDLSKGDCLVHYKEKGRTLAVAGIGRDVDALKYGETLANA